MAQVLQFAGGVEILIDRIALRMKNLLMELPRHERTDVMNETADRLEEDGLFLGRMPERPTPEQFVQTVILDNPNLKSSLRSQSREWNPLASETVSDLVMNMLPGSVGDFQ